MGGQTKTSKQYIRFHSISIEIDFIMRIYVNYVLKRRDFIES